MREPDAPPRPEVTDYVARAFPGAVLTTLAGDASARRFHRISLPDGETHILMDYGYPLERPTDDLHLNRIFVTAELRVARIVKIAREPGCLVLEDLGDTLLEQALAQRPPDDRRQLLRQATELAADIHCLGTPVLKVSSRADGPALDEERFRFEMDFFLEHYVGAYRGQTVVSDTLRAELHALAKRAADTPNPVLCHRDYHSRNLMLLDDGNLAMVDIQDARWGPDSYDLASLLRDAYAEIPEEWIESLIRHYLSRVEEAPAYDSFRRRFDVVAAQRMLKALGTFGHQIAALGRTRYTSAIPRTLARLDTLLPQRNETRRLHDQLSAVNLLENPTV